MTQIFKILIPDRLAAPADIEQSVFGREASIHLFQATNADQIEDKVWCECDAVLAWHEIIYDRELLSKMKNCKVIVRVGVGYDNVDIKAASEYGITVCNVPDYGTDDVADHTMAMMLSLCRGLTQYGEAAKQGLWHWEVGNNLRRIKGSTLGIIGLGRIGTAVALRAKSFGMNICFYDPYKPNGYEKTFSIKRADSLNELAKSSDIISIHAPLTNETNKMIDEHFFKACKQNSIFINTARGAIVELDALYKAMVTGKVLFAGLDVLAIEPPDYSQQLIKAWKNDSDFSNRIIITPHAAFYNQESFIEMRKKAAEEALRALTNEIPKYVIKYEK